MSIMFQYDKAGDDFIGRSAVPNDVEGMDTFLAEYHERLVAIGEVILYRHGFHL